MLKATILVVGMAAVLAVSAVTIASASDQTGPQLTEVPIERGFQSLGDDNPSWETTVMLRPWQLSEATSAHIELYLVGSEEFMNGVVINGRSFALPDTDSVSLAETEVFPKLLVSIPLGLLRPGPNVIGFEAGPLLGNPTNTHSDFDIGEVVLLLGS